MRIMAKLAGLAMNPKYARFLQKKWWPLWVIVGILLSGFIVIGAVLFLIWKLIKGIIGAYTDMFKKR
jgi:mannose/fructose/N-acetylgalactosamine-specific phosphotransferase system component IID